MVAWHVRFPAFLLPDDVTGINEYLYCDDLMTLLLPVVLRRWGLWIFADMYMFALSKYQSLSLSKAVDWFTIYLDWIFFLYILQSQCYMVRWPLYLSRCLMTCIEPHHDQTPPGLRAPLCFLVSSLSKADGERERSSLHTAVHIESKHGFSRPMWWCGFSQTGQSQPWVIK